MQKNCLSICVIAILSILTLCLKTSFAAVSVPITISEAKPSDVAGVSRINDLASFGVPILDADGVTNINQLGLQGSSEFQFRELWRYPSGNLKWVLVDCLTSVTAGGSKSIKLTDGTGNSSGQNIATDDYRDGSVDNNYITIDTGVAVFVVKKNNFNFIDMVKRGTEVLINYDTSKGMIINDGVNEYTSSNDSSSLTVIEENGPVKACIKSTGTMKNGSNSYLHYTARLFFIKGQSYCKAQITVRNASDDTTKVQHAISEFGVSIKMNVTGDVDYILAREGSTPVTGSAPGYLYQGYVTDYHASKSHDSKGHELIVGDDGLNINGAIYVDEATLGYAQAFNNGHIINMAMSFMGGYWPAGFEIESDGTCTIATYSKRNSVDANLAWGQHQTREIILEFKTSSTSPKDTLFKSQYPLMGRCNFTQYNNTGAALGNTDLITIAEQDQWLSENEFLGRFVSNESSDMYVRRHYYWASSGGFQNDWEEIDLLDWLRTGNHMLFNKAKEAGRFRADDAIMHSDDFSWKDNFPSYSNSNTWASPFDTGHIFWESLPLLYFLTGNEYIKESVVDMGEFYDEWTSHSISRTQNRVGGDMRVWSRTYKVLVLLSELLDNSSYKTIISNIVKMYITSDKWNYDRGYVNFEGASYLKTAQISRVHADAMYHALRVLKNIPGTEEICEDLSDSMLGWGYFQLNQEFVDETGRTPYEYELNQTNTYSTTRGCDLNWFYNLSYDLTGNTDFFSKRNGGNLLASGRGADVWAERSFQAFINRDINRSVNTSYVNSAGSGRVDMGNSASSPNITKSGSDYTLSWTTPADGITKYQIKFSDQPIVENLNFNQITRQYQYNPNAYDNFWAALNVDDEPAPAAAGTTQTYTINVQEKINEYNTRYNLKEGDSAYVKYDTDKIYYFAIKYWTGSANPPIPIADTTPPADVSAFAAAPGDGQVTLSWTNPTDSDFAGSMILYRTDGTYPVNHADGTLVCDRTGAPGSQDSFTHTQGVTNDTTYYYSACTYDQVPNYCGTAHVSATPTALSAPTVIGATPTNDTTPTWTWTSGGGNDTFRYNLDNSDLSAGATETTNTTYTPGTQLSQGSHVLYVQEQNDAGNWSSSGSFTIVIDTTPVDDPVITTNDGENYTADDSSITLTGTCTADTYAIYVNSSTDGVSYTPGETTWTYYTGTLSEGDNTFDITAYDAAGNVSSADSIVVSVVSSGETVSLYIQTESTTPDFPMLIGNESNPPASGGEYVYAPSGSGDTTSPKPESVYNLEIPHAGDYYLWLRMYGPSSSNDAMYIGFNGNFDRVYPAQTGEYEWVRVETTHGSKEFSHRLSAGSNQINIGHGEELARADMIFVTDDPDRNPLLPPSNVRIQHN